MNFVISVSYTNISTAGISPEGHLGERRLRRLGSISNKVNPRDIDSADEGQEFPKGWGTNLTKLHINLKKSNSSSLLLTYIQIICQQILTSHFT